LPARLEIAASLGSAIFSLLPSFSLARVTILLHVEQ
jgi:hypothetical protein